MIAVRAARLYAWSRVGVGVALTVAPSMAVPSLADRGSLGAIRLVGVLDLALGVHGARVGMAAHDAVVRGGRHR